MQTGRVARLAEADEFLLAHRLGESLDVVVARMDFQQQRGGAVDRILVIAEMRAVGGADLDQAAAGTRHDVGNAEAAADLDQLAPAIRESIDRAPGC